MSPANIATSTIDHAMSQSRYLAFDPIPPLAFDDDFGTVAMSTSLSFTNMHDSDIAFLFSSLDFDIKVQGSAIDASIGSLPPGMELDFEVSLRPDGDIYGCIKVQSVPTELIGRGASLDDWLEMAGEPSLQELCFRVLPNGSGKMAAVSFD